MGRKTKLTPELQAEIVKFLAGGAYIEDACAAVGLSTSSYYEWMRRGERGWKIDHEAGYVEFSDAVKKARASAAINSVVRIRRAGSDGTWQADAWFLERSYPDRWGRRRVDVLTKPDVEHLEETLTDLIGRYIDAQERDKFIGELEAALEASG